MLYPNMAIDIKSLYQKKIYYQYQKKEKKFLDLCKQVLVSPLTSSDLRTLWKKWLLWKDMKCLHVISPFNLAQQTLWYFFWPSYCKCMDVDIKYVLPSQQTITFRYFTGVLSYCKSSWPLSQISLKHFRAVTTSKHCEIAHTLGLASPNNGLSIPSYMLGYNIAIS